MSEDIAKIESSIFELDNERSSLQRDNKLLRAENKWFREKIAQLEKSLLLTEQKHVLLKSALHSKYYIALYFS